MKIKKEVRLSYEADDGSYIIKTVLNGDGSTPMVQTVGFDDPIGFNDDGTPIYPAKDDKQLAQNQQDFMAAAIAEQKSLCKENGVNPDLVNMIDAEKEQTKEEEK